MKHDLGSGGLAYERGRSLWQDAWQRLVQNRLAMVGLAYLFLQVMAALLAPWLTSHSYEETDLILGPVPPQSGYWFGTDDLGRDLLTRVLYGSRISLMVGTLATAVSLVIGVTYGAISGYVGGRTDQAMMRIIDIMYSLPFIFFVIILMVLFGRNIYLMFVALGAIQWLTMARIVRGQVQSLKHQEFIEAARAMGVPGHLIIVRHVVPNVLGPVIVFCTLTIPAVILEEAFLSFLGLGVSEPMSSWGTLISNGVKGMEEYPWMLFFPCLTLVLTLLALNFLGDGLRDALDPRASRN